MAKRKTTPRDTRAQVQLKFSSAAEVRELRRYADKWMEGNLAQYLRVCAKLVAEAGGPWAKFDKRSAALPAKEKSS